ncbi:ribosome maturation factor RimM [bacterium]|nr:ribosome maturation factor RimM [bacterium]
MINPETLVIVGKIHKHRGSGGFLTAKSFCVKQGYIEKGTKLYIEALKGEFLKLEVEECSFYKDKMKLKLCGYENFSETSKLVGKKLYIKRKNFPLIEEGEFYWTDVIGMDVYSTDGECLGRVTDIMETGSNDVFIVSKDSEEFLIPATREVIKKIDYDRNSILVELFEGLI